jgi:hypothetical protein
LSTEDALNFLSSPFAHIKSILKIWNPKRRLKLLKKALEKNDPSFEDNYLLRYAAAKGMKDVVELLLTYSTVDPRAKNNWALILAKENKHDEVHQLLVQRSPKNDIETGQIQRPRSSLALLFDVINAVSQNRWKELQLCKELQLLLDTSTEIFPHLGLAISQAIRSGKTELAKVMLFFAVFDDHHFNNMVFIKQLMRRLSFKDIRIIDPFLNGDQSIFINAVASGNFELANLILDKVNPFPRLISASLFVERLRILLRAADISGAMVGLGTTVRNGNVAMNTRELVLFLERLNIIIGQEIHRRNQLATTALARMNNSFRSVARVIGLLLCNVLASIFKFNDLVCLVLFYADLLSPYMILMYLARRNQI